jgi:diacylglycerol kinase family enzyme
VAAGFLAACPESAARDMSANIVVLINAKAGGVLQRGADATVAEIRAAFDRPGNDVDIRCLDPADMEPAIAGAAQRTDLAALIAGGGDGTLSTAASKLVGRDIALGCLPLGTMNLYCRALGMPLDPGEAVRTLAAGRHESVDVGEVNGRIFLHHVSIGLQPEIVMRRNREKFSGRMGKIVATVRSAIRSLRDPKTLDVTLMLSGRRERQVVPALFVTSNPLLTGRAGLAQARAASVLGLYICTSARWDEIVQLGAEVLLAGREDSDALDVRRTPDLTIERSRQRSQGFRASVDGEIAHFRSPMKLSCRPGALRLIVPA